ncbi:hypothetical protein HZH66_007862 [Vespula vulgaris]|uniref:Uncharacterized protein n=1 Tax=Vespula vulgaris TaxID=7454 RepID=A0A834JTZ3_VESVU|nr:hypothetical protein HZH66_007862 [Vespula vulgaris]
MANSRCSHQSASGLCKEQQPTGLPRWFYGISFSSYLDFIDVDATSSYVNATLSLEEIALPGGIITAVEESPSPFCKKVSDSQSLELGISILMTRNTLVRFLSTDDQIMTPIQYNQYYEVREMAKLLNSIKK